MKRLGQALLTVLFPHHCFLCGEVILPRQRLCADCARGVPHILPPLCQRCGRNEDDCVCRGHSRAYERCVSPFYHKGMVRSGIQSLKNDNFRAVVDGFAAEMAEVVRREYGGIAFDFITAVPMHRRDLRQRGFDQTAGLARALSGMLEIPYLPALIKLQYTQPQKELSAVRRKGNLLGMFDVRGDVMGKTVLLVDDVTTTGSTLEECAKMLKIFGAEEVYAVTAASALLQREEE